MSALKEPRFAFHIEGSVDPVAGVPVRIGYRTCLQPTPGVLKPQMPRIRDHANDAKAIHFRF